MRIDYSQAERVILDLATDAGRTLRPGWEDRLRILFLGIDTFMVRPDELRDKFAKFAEDEYEPVEMPEPAEQIDLPGPTKEPDLREELRDLLNRHSAENGSNTPDFMLADYLMRCLEAFERVVNARDHWHDYRPPEPKENPPQSVEAQ